MDCCSEGDRRRTPDVQDSTPRSQHEQKQRSKLLLLLVEPFYGGSHAQLVDLLVADLTKPPTPTNQQQQQQQRQQQHGQHTGSRPETVIDLVTMKDAKWHWRARTSALWLAVNIPKKSYRKMFITSVVNLAELVGLRPDLAACEKILYFHENQLEYPTQDEKERDFQFGYNQILSALAADRVLFNSEYNMRSFLAKMDPFLNRQPDHHTACRDLVAPKCSVLYFPITLERISAPANNAVLHIVWPHRWEHDKGPDELFAAMTELKDSGCDFRLIVLGQSFREVPEVFSAARVQLAHHIEHWGYAPTREDFLKLLQRSDVVVSTALHEFYGVAVLEAVFSGAFPLVPNRLSYPELFPKKCIYNTRAQLVKMLKEFCRKPLVPRRLAASLDLDAFHWRTLKTKYQDLLLEAS